MKFDELPLHDAILSSVTYDWASAEAVVGGRLVGKSSEIFTLRFKEVSQLDLSHRDEWGSSPSIYEQKVSALGFSIIMQSGDIINIEAGSFSFATKIT